MNTIGGIILSLLIGAIIWGLARFLTPVSRHPWGTRIFWMSAVAGLLISTQVPSPWNAAIMGVFGGAMIFEHVCQRYFSKFFNKPEKEEAAPKKKRRSPKP